MRGRSAIAVGALVAVVACDLARSPKLPPPPMPEFGEPSEGAPPYGWWRQGDAACPALEVDQTAPTGPPGQTLRRGKLVGAPPPNGLSVECRAGGVLHGPFTKWHDADSVAETGWNDRGQPAGVWITWHDNGRLASRGHYEHGAPVGVWSYYRRDGSLKVRGGFEHGLRTGMWVHHDRGGGEQGNPKEFKLYSNGSVTRTGFFDGGKPRVGHTVCAIGRADPYCRLILLGDLTVRVTPGRDAFSSESGGRWSGKFSYGGIVNLAPRHAIGLTGGWYINEEYASGGIHGRYRFWAADWLGIDLGYGVLLARDELEDAGGRGLSGLLAVSFADLVSFTAEVERYDAGDGREYAVHFGVRAGLTVLLSAAYLALHVGAR